MIVLLCPPVQQQVSKGICEEQPRFCDTLRWLGSLDSATRGIHRFPFGNFSSATSFLRCFPCSSQVPLQPMGSRIELRSRLKGLWWRRLDRTNRTIFIAVKRGNGANLGGSVDRFVRIAVGTFLKNCSGIITQRVFDPVGCRLKRCCPTVGGGLGFKLEPMKNIMS